MPIWLIIPKNWYNWDYIWDKYEKFEYNGYTYELWLNDWIVNLKWFWIDKVIEAEDLYIQIYNFLIKDKNFPNNQTDKEKVFSHWFDTKYWFRKRKN